MVYSEAIWVEDVMEAQDFGYVFGAVLREDSELHDLGRIRVELFAHMENELGGREGRKRA